MFSSKPLINGIHVCKNNMQTIYIKQKSLSIYPSRLVMTSLMASLMISHVTYVIYVT